MRNCFACDKQFEHHIESSTISTNYCSEDCQREFEAGLEAEIKAAQTSGIINPDGTPNINNTSTLNTEQAKKIISQFSTRIPNA